MKLKYDIRLVVIFVLLNTILLVFLGNIIVRLLFFIICTLILYKFGKLPFADVDPVPFASLLLLHIYDYMTALQFVIWTLPIADIISGRLNQFSFINLTAIFIALSITYFMQFLPIAILFSLFIILFNLSRLGLYFLIGTGLKGSLALTTHTMIYLFIIYVISGLKLI